MTVKKARVVCHLVHRVLNAYIGSNTHVITDIQIVKKKIPIFKHICDKKQNGSQRTPVCSVKQHTWHDRLQ